MTQFLPPNLLALFASRDPIPYKPPAVRLTWEKDHEKNPYTGVSSIVSLFEDPADTPAPTRGETKLEKKFRRIKEKTIIRANEIEEELKSWDPHNDKNATSDSFKTLFVSRINYDTSESKLRREFETYGRIRKINMVKDLQGKPRGYAFIEFEHERDMHSAYKNADGKKIDGRRVLVDVERGRTVKGWRPRRLGGGLGATRRGANEESLNESRRSEPTGNERLDEKKRDTHRSVSKESREKRTSRDRDRERHDRTDRNDRTDRSDRNRSDRKRDRDRREDRPKDRSKERDKDRSRNKERDRDRKRHRDKSKDRDRDGSRRKRSKERDRDRKGSERSSKKESDDKVRAEIKKEPKNGESQENNGMEEEDNQPAKTERNDDNVKIEQEIEEMNESQS